MSWTADNVREKFLEFFKGKGHKVVPSAPIVNKDDPTLMFTNAGMNQFKDFFLGNKVPVHPRVADTQKCLRVSGKHNDLEEVGVDSYHHTMFEMLGNWSFGDYFKQEAIEWSWELLTHIYNIPSDRLYASIFEGDSSDNLPVDEESGDFWKQFLPAERVLSFGKKDNFWEMGDVGPCGPCSEVHIDLRSDAERQKVDGATLVNKDHPMVVEIWNLVFIQYNRMADGSLKALPNKHVDTGMGFERLCMVLQGKKSSYDTDVFQPFIQQIEKLTGRKYNGSYERKDKEDIAFRVIADHLRAVCFTIADGALPSSTGAGYVVRRILRRAVRYYYSFLDRSEPLMHELVAGLAEKYRQVFPELYSQRELVAKVILEEERSFLRTLADGLRRFQSIDFESGEMPGAAVFELYDTYGFPYDLTALLAQERGLKIDKRGFKEKLAEQKIRSQADAKKEVGDWVRLREGGMPEFIGYDQLEANDCNPMMYRLTKQKGKSLIHLVLDRTPFYPEGGGQVGDTGVLIQDGQEIKVLDTFRENELIVHLVDRLPPEPKGPVRAVVNAERRLITENNHSATHLLHAALREVLGDHVQQKGSLVAPDHLRFDFAHFSKVESAQLKEIEALVNDKIRENIPVTEERQVPVEEARQKGATMLFGEKYGETVRVIAFDPRYSMELCGGCHVAQTGQIGLFKIVSESAVAAGIRRIVAVTGKEAETWVQSKLDLLEGVSEQLKSSGNPTEAVKSLQSELKTLRTQLEKEGAKAADEARDKLKTGAVEIEGVHLVADVVPVKDAKALKTLVFQLEKDLSPAVVACGAVIGGKPQLMLAISKELTTGSELHAGNLVRGAGKHFKGGGGGQPFFASAGGADPKGIGNAVEWLREEVMNQLGNK
jgi:alanyl-tRNA synthetase